MKTQFDRRDFAKISAASVGTFALATLAPPLAMADETNVLPIRKTLKLNMVRSGKTLAEKFAIAKQAGFEAIEVDSPGYSTEELLQAIDESQLPIDGTVCSTHWNVRHTDADPAVRRQALADLLFAIEQTHKIGGNTTLLVVGHGKDGDEATLQARSKENIRQAIPMAAKYGIVIAIENVWNNFLYDPNGDGNQSADSLAKYVDEFESPWVGMQYDIGNHWKFGNPGEWIKTLGKRIVKLDIKGFSRANDSWERISECDLPWQDVRKALAAIRFTGWCAAEVSGGDLEELKRVAMEMDAALGLKPNA